MPVSESTGCCVCKARDVVPRETGPVAPQKTPNSGLQPKEERAAASALSLLLLPCPSCHLPAPLPTALHPSEGWCAQSEPTPFSAFLKCPFSDRFKGLLVDNFHCDLKNVQLPSWKWSLTAAPLVLWHTCTSDFSNLLIFSKIKVI